GRWCKPRDLFRQADISAFAVAVRISPQGQKNSLRSVLQIEVRGPAQSTRADSPEFALETTSARHIEFVNHHAATDVGDSDVKSEEGLTDAEITEKETAERTSAIDQIELTFHQPAYAGPFAIFQYARGRDLLELLFQIFGEFHWRERFADRHLAVAQGFVAL